MFFNLIYDCIYTDLLSIIIICFATFMGIIIASFSARYMSGSSLYSQFFSKIFQLIISISLMSTFDNLVLFLIAWSYSNYLVTRLMAHVPSWKAAQASSRLAFYNFMIGSMFIGSGFALLHYATGSMSIQYIIHCTDDSWITSIALLCLFIGAMSQSGIWPFHRWLLSSLNSPTPVSAIMHAGIINAGGFLLIRFAPLYMQHSFILSIIFVMGLISAVLGAAYKLLQHDIKRALACSTIEQMGFMFMQFGLGFFGPALLHLCFHGFFKAYLFLNCSSSAQEKKDITFVQNNLLAYLIAAVMSLLSGYIFASIQQIPMPCYDTNLCIIAMIMIATFQLAITLLANNIRRNLARTIITTCSMATIYAMIIFACEKMIHELNLVHPQPFNLLHGIGLIILTSAFVMSNILKILQTQDNLPTWLNFWYVKTLNASQADPATITAHRKGYDYV